MLIRKYKKHDKDKIVKFLENIFPDNSHYHEKGLFTFKKSRFRIIYIAMDCDRIIGIIMGGYYCHRGWIDLIAVHKKFRGKDMGRILLKMIEDELKELGCVKINLIINELNTDAIEFCKKTGFETNRMISMCKIIK